MTFEEEQVVVPHLQNVCVSTCWLAIFFLSISCSLGVRNKLKQ